MNAYYIFLKKKKSILLPGPPPGGRREGMAWGKPQVKVQRVKGAFQPFSSRLTLTWTSPPPPPNTTKSQNMCRVWVRASSPRDHLEVLKACFQRQKFYLGPLCGSWLAVVFCCPVRNGPGGLGSSLSTSRSTGRLFRAGGCGDRSYYMQHTFHVNTCSRLNNGTIKYPHPKPWNLWMNGKRDFADMIKYPDMGIFWIIWVSLKVITSVF